MPGWSSGALRWFLVEQEDRTSERARSSVLPALGRGESRVRQRAGCFTEVKTVGPSTHLEGLQIRGGGGISRGLCHASFGLMRLLWETFLL